jgi:hypothetical protein
MARIEKKWFYQLSSKARRSSTPFDEVVLINPSQMGKGLENKRKPDVMLIKPLESEKIKERR